MFHLLPIGLLLSFIVAIANLFFFKQLSAQETALTFSLLSKRCQLMREKREKLHEAQWRLEIMLKKNLALQEATPLNKKSVMKKFKLNEKQIKTKLDKVDRKLSQSRETLLRAGCPLELSEKEAEEQLQSLEKSSAP